MIIREAYTKTEDFKKSIEIIKNFIKENLGGDIENSKILTYIQVNSTTVNIMLVKLKIRICI